MLILHPERLRGEKTGQQSPAEGHRALPPVPRGTVRPLQRLGTGSEFQRVNSSQGTQPGVAGRLGEPSEPLIKHGFLCFPSSTQALLPGGCYGHLRSWLSLMGSQKCKCAKCSLPRHEGCRVGTGQTAQPQLARVSPEARFPQTPKAHFKSLRDGGDHLKCIPMPKMDFLQCEHRHSPDNPG